MEDQEQPFAAFVLETLTRQSTELGQWWAERVQWGAAESGEPSGGGDASGTHDGAERLVQITGATSQLRLAAATGYTQAISDELRERYRMIRHDLRNPLGTIKTAVALLTDEGAPADMRESLRVRAMVVRNARSLDQVIGEALGDAAARLRVFDTSGEMPGDTPADSSRESAASAREQLDDIARARQRPDLESGAL
jgi:signal transduction histidine kinase